MYSGKKEKREKPSAKTKNGVYNEGILTMRCRSIDQTYKRIVFAKHTSTELATKSVPPGFTNLRTRLS